MRNTQPTTNVSNLCFKNEQIIYWGNVLSYVQKKGRIFEVYFHNYFNKFVLVFLFTQNLVSVLINDVKQFIRQLVAYYCKHQQETKVPIIVECCQCLYIHGRHDPQPEGPCRFHIEIFLLLSLSQSTNLYPVGEVGWEGRRAGGG